MSSETIKGYVNYTLWSGDGHRIIKFSPETGSDFVAAGNISEVDSDDLIELTGEWVDNPKYGRQLKVLSHFKIVPSTIQGKQAYIAKHVAGVGPARAKKLVDHFGHNITKVLEGDYLKLCECPGITEVAAKKISESWKKENDSHKRQVGLFLAQNGINDSAWTDKVIKAFGNTAVQKIQSNPYNLTSVNGIGFRTADRLAKSLGWPALSRQRTEAAFAYALGEATNQGHCFLFHGELLNEVKRIASKDENGTTKTLPDQDLELALEAVLTRKEIVQETVKINGIPEIIYYLGSLRDAEIEVATKIADLLSMPDQFDKNRMMPVVDAVEKEHDQQLSLDQKNAVVQAITKPISVITGLPGSGKSTTTKTLIEVAKQLGHKVVLCAPTGRAAKRLSEVTGEEAKTIHRLLQYNGEIGEFTKNFSDPIEGDLLIIDEFSMTDLELTLSLLQAVPPTMSVVIVGDSNQLPSIGPGSVLKDIITSGQVPVTNLDKIFRQAEGSLSIQNAHRICRGEMPQFPIKGAEADCYLVDIPRLGKSDDIDWVKKMLPNVINRIKDKLGIDPIRDVQILTPMKKGNAGYIEFNKVLQNYLNPDGQEFNVKGQLFRIGDRVMQTRNNYDENIELFNGDIGFVEHVNPESRYLTINFYDRKVQYPFSNSEDLILAYGSSIHRAQGSEFPVVIIILMNQHFVMLDRNLIYTANTRGKKMTIYLSSKQAIEIAVKSCDAHKRNSLLAHRIKAKVKAKAK